MVSAVVGYDLSGGKAGRQGQELGRGEGIKGKGLDGGERRWIAFLVESKGDWGLWWRAVVAIEAWVWLTGSRGKALGNWGKCVSLYTRYFRCASRWKGS